MSTAIWGGMGAGVLLTHCLDRYDDPQPSVGTVIVTALFQGSYHFARFRDRAVAMPIEMQVRGAENLQIRDRHDQAVTDFCS